jgi:hypothetical protein
MFYVAGAAIAAGGAYAASSKQSSGAKKAAGIAKDSASAQSDAQREMFYQQREDFQPYSNLGLRGLANYESALFGGPVQYDDPSAKLTGDEIAQLNMAALRARGAAGEQYFNNRDDDFLGLHLSRNQFDSKYDPNKTYYRGANGEITDTPQQLTANWDYKASPTLAPQTKMYNRALASRGLSGSGQAATGLADLASADYYKQLSLLGGLTDMGRGAATSLAGASQNYGNNMSSIYGGLGTNNVNASLAGTQAKAGLYSGLGGAAGNAAGLAIKLNNTPNYNVIGGADASGFDWNAWNNS